MVLRIGGGGRMNRNANIIDSNRGMAKFAQDEIDRNVVTTARKVAEAIQVDGHPVRVYVRNWQASIPCSCRDDSGSVETPEAPSYGTFETLNESDDDTVNAVRPNVFQDAEDTFSALFKTGGMRADSTVSGNPDIPDTSFDASLEADDATFHEEGGIESEDLSSIFQALFPFLISGSSCQICGGTGRVDGFRCVGVERHVFHANSGDFMMNRSEIDRRAKPARFQFNDRNSYVYWDLEHTPYFSGVLAARVRDNDKELPMCLQVNVGNEWVDYTPDLIARGTTGQTLRVFPGDDIADFTNGDMPGFTHVDVYLQTAGPFFVQLPQFDRESANNIESLITVEFELDPRVGEITKGSLLEIPGIARTLLVTRATNHKSSKGYVYRITGQGIVTQPSDPMTKYGLTSSFFSAVENFAGMRPHIDGRIGLGGSRGADPNFGR